MAHIHADIIGPLPSSRGYSYIFTIIDRATRWPDAIPITAPSAECSANALLQWIGRHGIPDTLVTDNGTNFTSNMFTALSQSLGFKLKHTTTYNPESNGIIERCHRTLKTALTTHCQSTDWSRKLPWILLSLRTTPHSALNAAPAEVLYGKNIRIPADLLPQSEDHISIADTSNIINKFLPPKITYNVHQNKIFLPKNIKESMFVYEKIDHHRPPLSFAYEGPFPIIKVHEKYATICKNNINKNVSLDRLKPAFVS